jgi:penicillin-binding protein 1A
MAAVKARLAALPGWVKPVAIALLALLSALGIGGAVAWNWLFHDLPELPRVETLWETGREPAMEFRAADGSLITIRGPRYGRVVRLTDLPAHVPQAFIAAEDKRFYEHEGMDTLAILRALMANVRAGETVQGASTLTQQVVKNFILTPERTFKRKAQEIALSQQLERELEKDEILELYLNRVYLGAQAFGVDAAAHTYFGKSSAELTLAEASLLATLPKAPSRLALDSNIDGAKERQAYVLKEMADAGVITPAQAEAAKADPVTLRRFEPDVQMGYMVDMAAAQARALLPPSAPQDLIVTLGVDPAVQRGVRAVVETVMTRDGETLAAGQAAAVFMRPDGQILALVGGRDYATSQFNRVVQGKRQPGSAFKLFVYLAALEAGEDAFSVRSDSPVRIGRWSPQNYNGGFSGPVTLREAFAQSLNTVAARLGQEVGMETVVALAKRLGVTSELSPLPALSLGTGEVSLMELTAAYGALASGGRKVEPWLIARIEDTRGRVLYERQPREGAVVLDDNVLREMNGLLLSVVEAGTGGAAAIEGFDVAGKTGTTQDWRDAWFVGMTAGDRGGIVGGVWVGNDDSTPMKRVTGGGLPAEIWAGIARRVLEGEKPVALAGAERVVRLTPEAEARLLFYRDLSVAFASVGQ